MNRSERPRQWTPYLLGIFTGVLLMVTIGELIRWRRGDLELYRSVRDLVVESFVGDVDQSVLVDDALRGMVGNLDPYSRYYAASELAQLDRETTGRFTGIGVVFKPPSSERRVLFPVPGGPSADKIDVGDRILAVDGTELVDLLPQDLRELMDERSGREVVLDLESRAGERRQETVVPTTVVDPTVRHAAILDRDLGIGYLSILAFSAETPREFDDEVVHLREQGMRSLIVDLRGNPGGVLQSAIELANRFIGEGDIVITRSRAESHAYRANPEDALFVGTPLVLLVNGDSASASEVFAGAVQDHRVGVLIGEPTYGKGMVQTLQPFGGRAVVKLSTSLYYTPADRQIDRAHTSECVSGIDPDLLVPIDNDRRARVHGHLATYSPPHELIATIERWEAEEGLQLLSSWPDDPQRAAARALLSGRVATESSG